MEAHSERGRNHRPCRALSLTLCGNLDNCRLPESDSPLREPIGRWLDGLDFIPGTTTDIREDNWSGRMDRLCHTDATFRSHLPLLPDLLVQPRIHEHRPDKRGPQPSILRRVRSIRNGHVWNGPG